jgi:uncharacterized membrane protein YgdD (TMEM256/DUF423 family)
MHKFFLITGSLLGALSVALGAFGAHSLKKIVSPEAVATFETGVRYQFYHTFALLIIGILYEKFTNKWLVWAGNSFLVGMLLFSGSLYVLSLLNSSENVGLRKIGIITPFGGLFFIAGWLFLMWGVSRRIG